MSLRCENFLDKKIQWIPRGRSAYKGFFIFVCIHSALCCTATHRELGIVNNLKAINESAQYINRQIIYTELFIYTTIQISYIINLCNIPSAVLNVKQSKECAYDTEEWNELKKIYQIRVEQITVWFVSIKTNTQSIKIKQTSDRLHHFGFFEKYKRKYTGKNTTTTKKKEIQRRHVEKQNNRQILNSSTRACWRCTVNFRSVGSSQSVLSQCFENGHREQPSEQSITIFFHPLLYS